MFFLYETFISCRKFHGTLFFALLLVLFTNLAIAGGDMKPLWEAGLVGIGGYVPDYPASDENRLKAIVLPYLVYRGDIFRAGDRAILRGRFIHKDRFELDISLDGSFDTESDENLARRGMPDLDYLFEVGPRMQITLKDDFLRGKIDLEIPLQGVIATDFSSLSLKGLVFQPQVAWQHNNFWGTGVRLKIGVCPIFATEDFMDYFFEVEPRFTTPARHAYDAQGGYLGSEMRLAAIRRIGKDLNIIGDMKMDVYTGSKNDDSPLFRDPSNLSIRVGLIWTPFQSKRKVRE